MSLSARVIRWLRAHRPRLESAGWERDGVTGSRRARTATTKRESSTRTRSARRRPPDPAGPARDPVLARYYANLELPYGAGLDSVHETWRRLVKKYHPDLHSADEHKKRIATELLQGLNRAYEELAKHLERK